MELQRRSLNSNLRNEENKVIINMEQQMDQQSVCSPTVRIIAFQAIDPACISVKPSRQRHVRACLTPHDLLAVKQQEGSILCKTFAIGVVQRCGRIKLEDINVYQRDVTRCGLSVE
ncbi:hypothetical protein BRADI_5g08327v3 [Brachypodium distachyon]|uniref:Uncharacterized protein n=1 Tax=Brachypodium distachyon TaxID=15368 RepID=A0A2K2CFX7_BRADI|nr:hypothetical protein BRADI_5g08327v3 [Brachypodium distachyon]